MILKLTNEKINRRDVFINLVCLYTTTTVTRWRNIYTFITSANYSVFDPKPGRNFHKQSLKCFCFHSLIPACKKVIIHNNISIKKFEMGSFGAFLIWVTNTGVPGVPGVLGVPSLPDGIQQRRLFKWYKYI